MQSLSERCQNKLPTPNQGGTLLKGSLAVLCLGPHVQRVRTQKNIAYAVFRVKMYQKWTDDENVWCPMTKTWVTYEHFYLWSQETVNNVKTAFLRVIVTLQIKRRTINTPRCLWADIKVCEMVQKACALKPWQHWCRLKILPIEQCAEEDWLNSYIMFPRTVLMEMCAELQPHLQCDTANSPYRCRPRRASQVRDHFRENWPTDRD